MAEKVFSPKDFMLRFKDKYLTASQLSYSLHSTPSHRLLIMKEPKRANQTYFDGKYKITKSCDRAKSSWDALKNNTHKSNLFTTVEVIGNTSLKKIDENKFLEPIIKIV